MIMNENESQIILTPITKQELFSIIEESIRSKVSEANDELLSNISKVISFDEILTFDELCVKFKREAPTVKKAIIALGIPPHSYDEIAKPLYLYSEVISALKENSKHPKWYGRDRQKYLEKSKNNLE